MVTPTVGSIVSNKKGTPMNEHFIKNIEIKNFKCFEDFKAEGFGRVNLIGGKNNVGKTAFMEALFTDITVKKSTFESFIQTILTIEFLRNHGIEEFLKSIDLNRYMKFVAILIKKYLPLSLKTNQSTISIKIKEESNIEIKLNDESYDYSDLEFLRMNPEIYFSRNFISSLVVDTEQLIDLYDGIKLFRKRGIINDSLKKFDSDIIEYDIINNIPVCFSLKQNTFVDLWEYGHGLKRYIAFICVIWANKDGYVFIDEIENGVHHTNLDKLWEVILTTSKEANVQVFATTHSKECIESYARVAKELEDEEVTFFKLGKNKEGDIKGMVYPYDWFVDSVEQEQELRGW